MKREGKTRFGLVLFIYCLITPFSYAQERVTSVDGVSINISEMDSIIGFYTKILPFKVISDDFVKGSSIAPFKNGDSKIRKIKLQLGDEFVELIDFIGDKAKPYPSDSRSNDLWFQHIAIIVSNMDSAYSLLQENKVHGISPVPQELPLWNKNAGGIKAYYFQDPDGHPLEILEFPRDKGNPKWQNTNGKLFLGIDHTAIAISDTEKSLRFYRDILGMSVKGESENWGTEQEKLNNVSGAHLLITGLRGVSGLGLEFLQYLYPGSGRPYPADAEVNDFIHWQTKIYVSGIRDLYKNVKASGYDVKSKIRRFKQTNGKTPTYTFLVNDPDGHGVWIVGK